jgi:hypothetical protein
VKAALVALLLPVLVASAEAPSAKLPDLDQAAPLGVSLTERHGRLLLVFGSAVDNIGPGALVVEGTRAGKVMRAWQVVGDRRYTLSTPLRYVRSATHQHWHLVAFERYELRRAGALVGRDRKTGFCLNDAYETHALNRMPRWTGACGARRPGARTIREGISPGFGDDYVPQREGQSIDVTGLPPGRRYVLVHRANPGNALRERSYTNNAASVAIELSGRSVRVLARCPDSPSCGT